MTLCRSGHPTVVTVLVQAGAGVNIQDNAGNTALHLGSERGHVNVVRTLLEEGANLNIANNEGMLPVELSHLVKVKKVRPELRALQCFEEYGIVNDKARYSKQEFGGVMLPNDRKSKVLNIISNDKHLSKE